MIKSMRKYFPKFHSKYGFFLGRGILDLMTLENFGQLRLTKTSMILCSFTLQDNFQFPTKVWFSSKIYRVKQNSQSVHIANKMYIVHYGNTDCGVFKWGVQN